MFRMVIEASDREEFVTCTLEELMPLDKLGHTMIWRYAAAMGVQKIYLTSDAMLTLHRIILQNSRSQQQLLDIWNGFNGPETAVGEELDKIVKLNNYTRRIMEEGDPDGCAVYDLMGQYNGWFEKDSVLRERMQKIADHKAKVNRTDSSDSSGS